MDTYYRITNRDVLPCVHAFDSITYPEEQDLSEGAQVWRRVKSVIRALMGINPDAHTHADVLTESYGSDRILIIEGDAVWPKGATYPVVKPGAVESLSSLSIDEAEEAIKSVFQSDGLGEMSKSSGEIYAHEASDMPGDPDQIPPEVREISESWDMNDPDNPEAGTVIVDADEWLKMRAERIEEEFKQKASEVPVKWDIPPFAEGAGENLPDSCQEAVNYQASKVARRYLRKKTGGSFEVDVDLSGGEFHGGVYNESGEMIRDSYIGGGLYGVDELQKHLRWEHGNDLGEEWEQKREGPILYLSGLGVRKDLRGEGLGTRLVRAAEQEGAEKGASWSVLLSMDSAERFYEQLGYEWIQGSFPDMIGLTPMEKNLDRMKSSSKARKRGIRVGDIDPPRWGDEGPLSGEWGGSNSDPREGVSVVEDWHDLITYFSQSPYQTGTGPNPRSSPQDLKGETLVRLEGRPSPDEDHDAGDPGDPFLLTEPIEVIERRELTPEEVYHLNYAGMPFEGAEDVRERLEEMRKAYDRQTAEQTVWVEPIQEGYDLEGLLRDASGSYVVWDEGGEDPSHRDRAVIWHDAWGEYGTVPSMDIR